MIRRVNFTGRKRIAREKVNFEIRSGEPRSFSARLDLSAYSFPPTASVVIEATSAGSSKVERFECGVIRELQTVCDYTLVDTEGENILFTVKVVDRTGDFGKLLAIAERIRASESGRGSGASRIGLLPVEARDLGDEVWKLHFGERHVALLINKDIPGFMDRIRTDPLFIAVAFPHILRTILTKALEHVVESDQPDDRWESMWQQFGKEHHPTNVAPPEKTDDDLSGDWEEWVEEVTASFCKSHSLKQKYMAALGFEGLET